MYRGSHIVIFAIALLLFFNSGVAQQGFYVPNQGKVFFVGDTATIFSNVTNEGKLGLGIKAVLNFKGHVWHNDPQSLLTDETNGGEGAIGIGGMVRFLATDTTRQLLNGGYNAATRTGPGFPNLQILNRNGVRLIGSSAKVRNELRLTAGHLFLDNHILVVGNNYPGLITNYDSSRFIVTGNAPGSGLLIRENIRATDNVVVFPVGSRTHQYTPAAIVNKTNNGDDFYVSVFDSVRSNATSGNNLRSESVNKTWEIGKLLHPNEGDVEIALQHLIEDEGAFFNAGRKLAYISKYGNGMWDTAAPLITPSPGILTTGAFLLNSGLNYRPLRNGMPNSAYYTKFTGKGDRGINRTLVWLSGVRIDYHQVKVFWTTNPEINNNYFVVQRRFSNQNEFTNIDTVTSKALNGYSIDFLNYEMIDPNSYTGITYYRLQLVDFSGRLSYSNIVAVGRTPDNQLLVWPNPSTGRFFVGIGIASSIKTIVIWDAVGRKVKEELVRDRNIIEMYLPIPGTYVVSFISPTGRIVDSKKLLVRGYY
ncbi:T9SS type A sorting domain-containing protein [Paraflavitalea sp. CAU 1676]|uniref:T9SS type A sorting domain-containing protein n=1 Tax=Paraflavitalea sp. CAU 1676 TaxID=3032598 RepID=UPI0023DBD4B6|nr:T9SS type A sorting domain-containing protein [Paraflavitalea sp. CAU 1676]MDF2190985.1 T9SS type A sorting domain-containing protein [Paraflavitalea sp. CAU 1676]